LDDTATEVMDMRLGVYVYSIGTIAAGVLNLIWGEFDPGHQPIQAWGDHIPAQQVFAYVAAVCLIAGGAAILSHRSARWGAMALGILNSIFGVFWFPRLYTGPRVLGFHINIYTGVLAGVGQQFILVAAALIRYATAATRESAQLSVPSAAIRWIFGLCVVDFGLAHLTGVRDVPRWSPSGYLWLATSGPC
jgi:hypothetical protein